MLGEMGEGAMPGEVSPHLTEDLYKQFLEVIEPKLLTFDVASRCLSTLGKDESGIRYAYLMLAATDLKLTDISIILKFKHVLFVDVSGNYLELDALQVLVDMPFLILLKAERNRIKTTDLKVMPYLQILALNKNQITETRDMYQPFLDTLELSNNLIYLVEFNPSNVKKLIHLDLRGNQLIDVSGIYPTSLEKLYLPANRIVKIMAEDLSKLTKLKILHLRENKIHKLNGFTSQLVNLNYLNLRSNKIRAYRQFVKLQCLPNLETLIVTDNPVCGIPPEIPGEGGGEGGAEGEEMLGEGAEKKDMFRISMLVMLPNLKRINKTPVTPEERDEAFFIEDQRMEEIMAEASSDEDEIELATTTEPTTDYTTETETEVGDKEE